MRLLMILLLVVVSGYIFAATDDHDVNSRVAANQWPNYKAPELDSFLMVQLAQVIKEHGEKVRKSFFVEVPVPLQSIFNGHTRAHLHRCDMMFKKLVQDYLFHRAIRLEQRKEESKFLKLLTQITEIPSENQLKAETKECLESIQANIHSQTKLMKSLESQVNLLEKNIAAHSVTMAFKVKASLLSYIRENHSTNFSGYTDAQIKAAIEEILPS